MQNDFTSPFLSSELPDEAALLGFASSDLPNYIADDDENSFDVLHDYYFNGRPVDSVHTVSNALRSWGFGCSLSINQVCKWMRERGVTFDDLVQRGVDSELVEILKEVCNTSSHIDIRGLYSRPRNWTVHHPEIPGLLAARTTCEPSAY